MARKIHLAEPWCPLVSQYWSEGSLCSRPGKTRAGPLVAVGEWWRATGGEVDQSYCLVCQRTAAALWRSEGPEHHEIERTVGRWRNYARGEIEYGASRRAVAHLGWLLAVRRPEYLRLVEEYVAAEPGAHDEPGGGAGPDAHVDPDPCDGGTVLHTGDQGWSGRPDPSVNPLTVEEVAAWLPVGHRTGSVAEDRASDAERHRRYAELRAVEEMLANYRSEFLTLQVVDESAMGRELRIYREFVDDDPETVRCERDADGRLHRRDGPAYVHSSGRTFFAIEGIQVPDWVVEPVTDDEELARRSARLLNEVPNLERRRVAIALWGWARTAAAGGWTVVDEDPDPYVGTLYELPDAANPQGKRVHRRAGSVERFRLLVGRNASPHPGGAYEVYAMLVDPSMATARAAQASLWPVPQRVWEGVTSRS